MLEIEEGVPDDGKRGEHNVVQLIDEFFIEEAPRVHAINTEPEVRKYHDHVLVKVIAHQE